MIPVSLFSCSPQALRADPDLGPALRAAGVTHLEVDAVESIRELDICKIQGWRVILIGDNFMRTPGDAAKNCTQAIVTDRASRAGMWGICDGIEMVDETKQDPAAYPMARQFIQWWRSAGGPPIAWPGHAPQRWENAELSDYDSRQWNWWTCKVGKDRTDRLKGSLSRAPTTRGLGALIDASGMYGTMQANGKVRTLYGRKPPSGLNILKQFQLAHSFGATRYRVWAWDSPAWQRNREQAKVGDKVFVGIHPGDRRWEYLVDGIKAVKEMAA